MRARALGEELFGDRQRRESIGPADIEGEMRDDLRNLARLDAVLERAIEIVGQGQGEIAGYESRDRDEASIARRQTRTFPYLAVKAICVYFSSAGATLRTSSGDS